MNHNKRTFRIIIYLSAFIVLTGLAGLVLQHFLNDRIKELFIRELNNQLTTEVEVEKVKLSLFKDFPYASVRFSGVKLREAVNRPNKGILLNAGVISLRFGLPDLLRNRFTVTNVLILNAKFNMCTYRDGSDNFHFWKTSAANGGKGFTIDLQRISILNSLLTYRDESSGQDMRFMLADATMKGKFAEENYLMEAKGDLLIELFTTGNTTYVRERQANFDFSINVNNKKNLYTLQKCELYLNDLHLSTSGWVIDTQERHELDLNISASEATLAELVSTIPAKYKKPVDEYQFNGRAKVSIHLKGLYGGNLVPAITAELTLNEGVIGRKRSEVALEDVSLVAGYSTQQDLKNEKITITGLKAKLKNGSIAGAVSIEGSGSSLIAVSLKADLDLEDARELLNYDTITTLKGRLFLDWRFDGKLANIKHPTADDLARSRLSGHAQVMKGELGLKGYHLPATGIEGSVVFENNNLYLKSLAFRYGKSDFNATGTVNNVMAWIMIKNQKLNIQGAVSSGRTDWDEVSESSSGSGEYDFQLPGDIDLQKLKVTVRDFTFRKFSASGISANLTLNNKIMTANNIMMQSMKGIVSGQMSINASNPGHSLIQCKATISKVNLKNLFVEFGNFGSTELTSENLDGSITADVIYASTMFPTLGMDPQSVKAHADIRVENGRLVNYEPMKGLSKFLRVEDLADIRFETLQNQIDIANGILYIPGMQIKSSAIDLTLMGTHTFSNELDYHFSLVLADLLAAKFHKRNPAYNKQSEFGPVEDDGRGRTMVYVSMTGTVDNPIFGYDRKAVREKLTTELRNQKSELRDAFRKEFGSMQGDTIKKSQNAKEKAIRKKQEEGKFVIEWDDDKKAE